MGNAYFQVLHETADGGRYRAGPATVGPWDPGKQHGGPPTALGVRAAERLAADRAGAGDAFVAVRVSVEFLTAVPAAELVVRSRVVRPGRNVTLVAVTLGAAEAAQARQAVPGGADECLHARVWLVRGRDTAELAPLPSTPAAPPAGSPSPGLDFPYADSLDWFADTGSMDRPGPAAMWVRTTMPLIEGEQLTGLQRVALVCDSASGVSAELDWSQWAFPNVDLDIHLARPFRGEWLHLAAATQLGEQGFALTRSTVSDGYGPVGCSAQTLILAQLERPTP